jgi:hypothetical protein
MKRKTNFDLYLEEHLKDPEFAERFRKAEEVWDTVIKGLDPGSKSQPHAMAKGQGGNRGG